MKLRSLSLVLALLLLSAATVHGAEYDVTQTAFSDEITIHGFAGCELVFSREDFAVVPSDSAGELRGIVITRVPDSGSLVFSERIMYAGEAVTAQTLDTLRYVPSSDASMETSFQFIPVYDGEDTRIPVTVTLVLAHKENLPPVAEDVAAKTYRDIAIRGRFIASDPEGDAVSYRITAKAKRGEVEIGADGTFIYTPFRKKTGADSFRYVAVDAYGNTSEEATVRIEIEKPSTKTTYADMEGHEAAYAALRLHEEDVFTGENVCGVYYFRPDELVSRAELITMTVRLLGLDEALGTVSYTGFADDSTIPVWFKPYAQAALTNGIIRGTEASDGRLYANATSVATFNEAAVILNSAATLNETTGTESDVPVSASLDAVAVWAASAVSSLDANRILPTGVTDFSAQVTRADAALMLCKIMELREARQGKGGLLSWVFGT